MHICPNEIMALAAVATVGTGGLFWLRWKWRQFVSRVAGAFMFLSR